MSRLSSVIFVLLIAVCATLAAGDARSVSEPGNQAAAQLSTIPSFERQISFYKQKVQANPKDAIAHNMLGICYQNSQRVDEAVKEYKQATGLNAGYAEAWNNLGTAHHLKKNLKQAVKHYRKAIQLKPELASAHRNLGTALVSMGKITGGLESYQNAYQLDRTIFEASSSSCAVETGEGGVQFFFFAKVSAAAGQIDAALDLLEKACRAGFRDFTKVEKDADFQKVVVTERYENLKAGVRTVAENQMK